MNEQNQPERISSKYLDTADQYNMSDAQLMEYLEYQDLDETELNAVLREHSLRKADKFTQDKALVNEKIKQIEIATEDLEQPQQEGDISRVGIGRGFAAGVVETYGKLDYLLTSPATPYLADAKLAEMKLLAESIREGMRTVEGDLIENINPFDDKGNFIDGLNIAASSFAESIPYLAISASTGGMGIAIIGSAEGMSAYHDVKYRDDMTEEEKLAYSAATGLIEGVSEGASGLIARAAFKKAAKTVGESVLQRQFAKGVLKASGISTTEEAIAEFGAGFLQSVNEQYYLSDKDIDVDAAFRSGINGAIVGGFGGAVIGAGGYTAGAIKTTKEAEKTALELDEQYSSLEAKRKALMKELDNAKTDAERQSVSELLYGFESQRRELQDRASKRLRVMRRRNPEALEKLNMRSRQIAAAKVRYESTESEPARKAIKENIESLIKDFNKINAEAIDADSDLTISEYYQDALDDISIAISETEADLEAVEGFEFESDNDLLVFQKLKDRVSSLKSKKKELMRIAGEIDAAVKNNDVKKAANLKSEMMEVVSETLPSSSYQTAQQVEDDLGYDASTDTSIEAEEQVDDFDAVVADSDTLIREGFAQEEDSQGMNFGITKTINNLLSSFKGAGLKVVWHKTDESYNKARGSSSGVSRAFYDRADRAVHLRPQSTPKEVRHEFIHGALRELLADSEVRSRLLREIDKIAESDPAAFDLKERIKQTYIRQKYKGADLDEEIIVNFIDQLLEPSVYENYNSKSFVERILNIINRLLGTKFGVPQDMLITDVSDLRDIVKTFKFAEDTGRRVDVQKVAEANASGVTDALSKAYPDLRNKEVSYIVYYPTYNGRSNPVERTVTVNDYFHWRNFWASMTGNGRKNWIKNASYIGEDGKRKEIKTPSPKRDRNTGDVLEMPSKLKSSFQMRWEKARMEDEIIAQFNRDKSLFRQLEFELEKEGIDTEILDREDFGFIKEDLKIDSLDVDPISSVKMSIKPDARVKVKKGDLKDYEGLPSANAPYDPTDAKKIKGSGINNLKHPKDSSRKIVFSVSSADKVFEMLDAINKALKAGHERFVISHSPMSDDSVLSNPVVYQKFLDQIEDSIKNDIESNEEYGKPAGDNIRNVLMNIANDFVSSENISGKRKAKLALLMQGTPSFDLSTGQISNSDYAFKLLRALGNDSIVSFESRAKFLKNLKSEKKFQERHERETKRTEESSFMYVYDLKFPSKEFIDYYKIESFKNLPLGAIVAAKVIDLRTDENGLPNFKLEKMEEGPFPYSITVNNEDLEFVTFDKQYDFYDAYSSYAFKEGSAYEGKTIGEVKKTLKDLEQKEEVFGIKRPQATSMRQSLRKVNVGMTVVDELGGGKTDSLVDVNELQKTAFSPREQSYFETIMTRFKVKLQDRYARVMMLQEDIERYRGKAMSEDKDFKMAEELMHGTTKNDLEVLEDRVKSIADDMKRENITSDDVSEYLYAKHAKERNDVIFQRTEGRVEGGSGMTDQRAEEILNKYEGRKKEAIDRIASKVYEITKDTRDTYVKLGMEEKSTITAFEDMFENYVPLSGIASDELDAETSFYPTGGSGLAVYGSLTKKARGRKTEASNILAQVIAQNAQAKVKGRKNEALNKLHNLVSENPNEKVWRIASTVKYDSDHAVGVRVNGEQKYIVFRDASMAKSLKNMGVEKLDFISKLLRSPAVWLRRSFTTANPEFIISNFARDIQSSVFNAMAEAEIEGGMVKGKDVALKIVGRTKETLAGLSRNAIGKEMSPEMTRYFNEFREDGGQTGWAHVKPISEIAAEIESMVSEESKTQKAINWMAKNSIEVVENLNDAFENSIRLASYIEARESGASRKKAAQLAKNITVNFNKHGELGPVLNAWFLFFNASVQGTARLGRSLFRLKPKYEAFSSERKGLQRMNSAQKLAIGLSTITSMLTMINISLSDEDEDGELFYNKIPDYEKERNLIMMYDGKHYIKIPLPYGFNIFSNIGMTLAEVSTGNREPVDGMLFTANSVMSSFSPISFGQSKDMFDYLGKAVTPTVFKPIVEIMTNETYFGGSVYREQFPVGAKKPESQLGFKSPKNMQDFFMWMNEATGGNEFESGWIDANPDKFWHIFDYYLGGAGQFLGRTGEFLHGMGASIAEGEKLPIEANDVPFLRKLYGDPSKYYDYQLYSDRKEEIQQLYKTVKSGDYERGAEKYRNVGGLNNLIKDTEKRLKIVREKRKKANKLPYAQRQIEMAKLFEKEREIVMRFNKRYNESRN